MDNDYILHKYLNGEASPEEIDLLKASPEYNDYLKISDASADFDVPDYDSDTNFKSILEQRTKRLSKNADLSIKRFLKIAAVFLVLAAGYLFISSMETSVNTQIAEKKSFNLPDNSIVELNSRSAISYKKRKWSKNRTLTLEGEAYFKVAKGSKFDVKTELGVVSVLGTQFNVYARDTVFDIKCFEGLVSVSFNDTIIKLAAGSHATIQNKKIVVQSQINSTQPVWIANESSFESETISRVLAELKRQFPVRINAPESIMTMQFTGSFTHKNLETALQSICDPLRLGYTVEDNIVTIYAK